MGMGLWVSAMVLAGAEGLWAKDAPTVQQTMAQQPGPEDGTRLARHQDAERRAELGRGFLLEGMQQRLTDREQRLGRGMAFGYALDGRRTVITVRAGYRFGLPLDDALAPADDSLVLRSGGTVKISAGTVAWLQLDFEGFRELAGARLWRFDAIPGIRVRPYPDAPVEAGLGCVASFASASGEGKSAGRLAGAFQLAGNF